MKLVILKWIILRMKIMNIFLFQERNYWFTFDAGFNLNEIIFKKLLSRLHQKEGYF